ncbi:MAG: ATP-binding cassette domain-containing protein [Campylobacteraceae bacterium]
MKESVLKVQNISFSYKDEKLLYDGFSLHVNKGELVCLLGQSGSGKSTLFELIVGNLKPKFGTISHKSIAQIYQDPYSSFHPTFCIKEQLEDVIKKELKKDEYLPLLEKLTLDEKLLYTKPHLLSGGQLQRFSILRCLLLKPELILADEPTSALDNITQLEVLKYILTLLKDCGILLITHDKSLATWCADRIITLENR